MCSEGRMVDVALSEDSGVNSRACYVCVSLYIYISVYLYICISTYLSVCVSTYLCNLYVCLYLSINQSIYVCICLSKSLHISTCLWAYVYLFVYIMYANLLSFHHSKYPSISACSGIYSEQNSIDDCREGERMCRSSGSSSSSDDKPTKLFSWPVPFTLFPLYLIPSPHYLLLCLFFSRFISSFPLYALFPFVPLCSSHLPITLSPTLIHLLLLPSLCSLQSQYRSWYGVIWCSFMFLYLSVFMFLYLSVLCARFC